MSPTPIPITTTKLHFLQTQTRNLSSPLTPTPTWQSNNNNNNNNNKNTATFPPKPLTDLLNKLNNKLKSHNRLVFSTASQRHVAEQIDALYWNEVSSAAESADAETVWVATDTDLTERRGVDGLPADVDEGRTEKVDRLLRRRDELRRRVDGYRALRGAVAGFEDLRGVQGNLVGREGELVGEVERLRVLVARVHGGLAGVVRDGGDGEMSRREDGERDKLRRVLEMG